MKTKKNNPKPKAVSPIRDNPKTYFGIWKPKKK